MLKTFFRQPLWMVIVLVLLAHGLVLRLIPVTLNGDWLSTPSPDMPPVTVTFSTRTLEPESETPIPTAPPSPVIEKTDAPHRATEDAPLPPPDINLPEREVGMAEEEPEISTEPEQIAIPKEAPKETTLAAVWQYRAPPSATLDYEVDSVVDGTARTGAGELHWSHDGINYNARLGVSYFRITLRTQTSTGKIGTKGLEPRRFGDKTRSEVAAHFEREKGKISFSANTPDIPLQDGAQDQLSVILQLGALLGGNPERISEGTSLPFQAVGARSAENWTFMVGKMERLNLPGGEVMARHLWRQANAQYDVNVDVWLAPDLGYLPVRIRLTQTNGNIIDQRWRSTEKP
ncbi:MAG: hypothetical protein RLZZ495_672 [Pseudomonadota bacterium]|jgi:hypothetical protein